jgi:Chlorophyll A-B binding protein
MKSIIAASLVASAVAFAPAQQSARTSVATEMAKPFSDALGAQAPLGFFDPLGMVADGDQAKFDRLRFVELKHGRICMLGVVGYLTNKAGIYLPGDIDYSGTKFSDLGSGWDASFNVPVAGALQILVFVGMLELGFMKDATGQNEFVGDFRNGAIDFGWDTLDSATQLKKRAIELNQGRAAQMGLLGLMVHDKLGNVDILLPSV